MTCSPKIDSHCRDIFEDSFSLVSSQYVDATKTPVKGKLKYVPVLDNYQNRLFFMLNLTVPENGGVNNPHEEYCLTFNFNSSYQDALMISAETPNAGYSIEYRNSSDGQLRKVCTSWLQPFFAVKHITITFLTQPYGLVDRFWVQLVRAEWVKRKWSTGTQIHGTGDAKKRSINWPDLFVNVPREFDVSKDGEIGFKVRCKK